MVFLLESGHVHLKLVQQQQPSKITNYLMSFKSQQWQTKWNNSIPCVGICMEVAHEALTKLSKTCCPLLVNLWTRTELILKSVRVASKFTHEPIAVTMELWEPTIKCSNAVPTHLPNHLVWSRTLKCSVKPYVTGPSTNCYFNVSTHTW